MDQAIVQKYIDKLQRLNNDYASKILFQEVHLEDANEKLAVANEQIKVLKEELDKKNSEVLSLNEEISGLRTQYCGEEVVAENCCDEVAEDAKYEE